MTGMIISVECDIHTIRHPGALMVLLSVPSPSPSGPLAGVSRSTQHDPIRVRVRSRSTQHDPIRVRVRVRIYPT